MNFFLSLQLHNLNGKVLPSLDLMVSRSHREKMDTLATWHRVAASLENTANL